MLLKVLFWLFVALDAVGLGLWCLLGLAAAGPSKTQPAAVVLLLLVVPGLVLAGAVALFLQTQSVGWRVLALLVVSGPTVGLAVARLVAEVAVRQLGPGLPGSTPLTRALRELARDPAQLATVRKLLDEGAAVAAGETLPLVLAIYAARRVGREPVQWLLAAGADANAKDEFGRPAFFAATASDLDVQVLELLLDHGADPQARGRDGRSSVWDAVNTRNWPAALLLLRRGAAVDGRSPMGLSLRDTLEGELRVHGGSGGASEVLAAVRAREK